MNKNTKFDIDFHQLSETQLQYLLDQARQLLEARWQKRRAEVVDIIRKLAASVALEVEVFDLGETARHRHRLSRGRKPAPPKYRHPDNSELVWSGRGKQPHWFSQLLDQGYRREDLEIRD